MTADEARKVCSAAGLVVLSAEAVGRQVRVCVEQPDVTIETVIGKLAKRGLGFTVSFGDGTVDPTLWFAAAHEDA